MGRGAAACLAAKHKALMCDKSFSPIRRLSDADLRPTVSYGCEVWAPACSLALVTQLKDMQGIQISFFRKLCQLRKSITPHIICKKFAERPWLDSWWTMVLACGHSPRQHCRCTPAIGVCPIWPQGLTGSRHGLSFHFFWDWGFGQPWVHGQVGKASEAGWGDLHVPLRTALPGGQSFAHITMGLA